MWVAIVLLTVVLIGVQVMHGYTAGVLYGAIRLLRLFS